MHGREVEESKRRWHMRPGPATASTPVASPADSPSVSSATVTADSFCKVGYERSSSITGSSKYEATNQNVKTAISMRFFRDGSSMVDTTDHRPHLRRIENLSMLCKNAQYRVISSVMGPDNEEAVYVSV